MTCEVVKTRSGVSAIRDLARGEVMHPGAGPAVEATNLYINPSMLRQRLSSGTREMPPLVLFDIGLGAASNAIAAWKISEALPSSARSLTIVSFEHDLAPLRLALSEEHRVSFGFNEDAPRKAAEQIVQNGNYATARTAWHLRFGDMIETLQREAERADIVFWDPYSPKSDPHLWSRRAFTLLRNACAPSATVHTYSAATPVRAAMLLAGFYVGTGEATGDKVETTVAAYESTSLKHPLGKRWLMRFSRSTSPLPAEFANDSHARAEALASIANHPQFSA